MKNDLFDALMSSELERMPPTTRERLMGDTRIMRAGASLPGYDSRAPQPIGIDEMRKAQKAKDKRKARKKMRQQSRKKK